MALGRVFRGRALITKGCRGEGSPFMALGRVVFRKGYY